MVVDMWLTAPTGRFYARWFGFRVCAIVFALVQHIFFAPHTHKKPFLKQKEVKTEIINGKWQIETIITKFSNLNRRA